MHGGDRDAKRGKRRLILATFLRKERLNFPSADRYDVDIVTHVDFMAGKTQRSIVAHSESRFPLTKL